MFNSYTPDTAPVIAGRSFGKRIRCTPQAKPVYDNMVNQARHNYWAHMVVSGIEGLRSGQMHMNNVFIKQQEIANNNSEFHIVLPGCTATMAKTANGEYHLLYMRADERYFEQQKIGAQPGMHNVTKASRGWRTHFNDNGQITHKDNRFVAITDRRGSEPAETIKEAYDTLKDNPLTTSFMLESNTGFDMHYTPGDQSIGGLTNIRQAMNAQTDPELHESAILLAKSMHDARDIPGVQWVSEAGGSGVLCQALQILADQNITLDKHAIFLCNPTTRQTKVVELSLKLGLGQPRNISKNNLLRSGELVGGLGFGGGYGTAYQRLKKDDNYTALMFTGDMVKESTSLKKAGGTAVAVGAAVSLSSAGASLPAIALFAGAVMGVAGLGKTLTEAYLPRLYHKIAGKF